MARVTGLGKIAVPTPGTPVPLATDRKKVAKVIVSFDPADGTGKTVFVKDKDGNIVAALTNVQNPVELGTGVGDSINLAEIQVDASSAGAGPFVGYEE